MIGKEPEPATQLEEEPQAERGAAGSRDTGSDEAAGGPVDRTATKAKPEDSTGIDPQVPRESAESPGVGG